MVSYLSWLGGEEPMKAMGEGLSLDSDFVPWSREFEQWAGRHSRLKELNL